MSARRRDAASGHINYILYNQILFFIYANTERTEKRKHHVIIPICVKALYHIHAVQTQILRIAFYDEGEIYIVPLNYGY